MVKDIPDRSELVELGCESEAGGYSDIAADRNARAPRFTQSFG